MKSGWVDRDAEAVVADGAKAGIDPDLSLRVYTTRLLGRDPKLVLHGGGNTSLKTTMRDPLGAEVEVLRVKASGVDMASIELAGFRARQSDRRARAKSLGRGDAARFSAAQIHRPHPRHRSVKRCRPTARRTDLRGGFW